MPGAVKPRRGARHGVLSSCECIHQGTIKNKKATDFADFHGFLIHGVINARPKSTTRAQLRDRIRSNIHHRDTENTEGQCRYSCPGTNASRFAITPGNGGKALQKGHEIPCRSCFSAVPGREWRPKAPPGRPGRLCGLCVSVVRSSLFPCALRSQQLPGLMSLCMDFF